MANKRRKLVTAAPELPLELVQHDSPILRRIDELSEVICTTEHPQKLMVDALIPVVSDIRRDLSNMCRNYSPMPDDNPFYADGYGVLCGSGNNGNALRRGKLCTKVCRVGNPDLSQGLVSISMQATA